MTKLKIIYSPHLKFRLKVREIPRLLPKQIFQGSREHYFDNQTGKFIAASRVKYKGRMREMAVIYDRDYEEIILITTHPLKNLQKSHRIKARRWQKI